MGQEGQLAKALGWFSIGLGLAEVFATKGLAQTIGVQDSPENQALLRLLGLREIASGVEILTHPHPVGGMRSRVGGDVMDLALLGAAFQSEGADQGRVAAATMAVLGVAALDVMCSEQLAQSSSANGAQSHAGAMMPRPTSAARQQRSGNPPGEKDQGKAVTQGVIINAPAEDLYTFWHDFENLATFMTHLDSVEVLDNGRSHWKAKAPAGTTVEWDAEIVEDVPNQRIAWRSLENADVENAGSVEFAPATGGRGTVVKVEMQYKPPAGAVGALVAKLFGEEPQNQVYQDLHRFKQLIETGEIMRSDASMDGMGSPQRPGQPAAE